MSYSRQTLAAFSESLAALYAAPSGPEAALAESWPLACAHAAGGEAEDMQFLATLLATHRLALAARALRAPLLAGSGEGSPDFLGRLQALGLTGRECEVLHWIAHGKRDAEIARILGIATKTVSKHVEKILAKLGAETRLGAVHTAQLRLACPPGHVHPQ